MIVGRTLKARKAPVWATNGGAAHGAVAHTTGTAESTRLPKTNRAPCC